MIATQSIAREALRTALEIRADAGVGREAPICVFDLAERLSLNVWFCAAPSFEGMFERDSNSILIPSQRPKGRQAFTCAHELGHWALGHGTRVDLIPSPQMNFSSEIEERAADIFAGFLLMTPWAMKAALGARGIDCRRLSPLEAYGLAGQFGVSYEGLLQHMTHSLRLLPPARLPLLLQTSPAKIREQLVGPGSHRQVIIVDAAWRTVAVDLSVGDLAIVPENLIVEGPNLSQVGSHRLGRVLSANFPGIGRLAAADGTFAAFVRVSRQEFEGRNLYRHMEDPDVD